MIFPKENYIVVIGNMIERNTLPKWHAALLQYMSDGQSSSKIHVPKTKNVRSWQTLKTLGFSINHNMHLLYTRCTLSTFTAIRSAIPIAGRRWKFEEAVVAATGKITTTFQIIITVTFSNITWIRAWAATPVNIRNTLTSPRRWRCFRGPWCSQSS